MTDISLIICSRDRAEALRENLSHIDLQALKAFDVELMLVDSASSDATGEVMRRFARSADAPVRLLRAEQPGLTRAQNIALRHAAGELIVFTDDDCRLAPDYFQALAAHFDRDRFDFGGGRIEHGEANADDRMAATGWLAEDQVMVLPPKDLLFPGTIQGANMFAKRAVFEAIGGFSELLGPGSVVGSGADTEFSQRASHAGFRGVVLGPVLVRHFHGNQAGSPQAQKVVRRYDRGRGGYFASLMALGRREVFSYWHRWMGVGNRPKRPDIVRLIFELRGAADFLEASLKLPPPARRGWRADYPDVMPPPADSATGALRSDPAAPTVS